MPSFDRPEPATGFVNIGSPEEANLSRLLHRLVGTGSPGAARAFIDRNPRVRQPNMVTALMNSAMTANGAGEAHQAKAFHTYAMEVCGTEDPIAPAVINEVLVAASALMDGAPADPAMAGRFLDAARSRKHIDAVGVVSPRNWSFPNF